MAKRGTCETCGADVGVTKIGTAMKHGFKCGRREEPCEGTGKTVVVKPKMIVKRDGCGYNSRRAMP
jgi:hypothetical protein